MAMVEVNGEDPPWWQAWGRTWQDNPPSHQQLQQILWKQLWRYIGEQLLRQILARPKWWPDEAVSWAETVQPEVKRATQYAIRKDNPVQAVEKSMKQFLITSFEKYRDTEWGQDLFQVGPQEDIDWSQALQRRQPAIEKPHREEQWETLRPREKRQGKGRGRMEEKWFTDVVHLSHLFREELSPMTFDFFTHAVREKFPKAALQEPLLQDTKLKLFGSLIRRGWSINDADFGFDKEYTTGFKEIKAKDRYTELFGASLVSYYVEQARSDKYPRIQQTLDRFDVDEDVFYSLHTVEDTVEYLGKRNFHWPFPDFTFDYPGWSFAKHRLGFKFKKEILAKSEIYLVVKRKAINLVYELIGKRKLDKNGWMYDRILGVVDRVSGLAGKRLKRKLYEAIKEIRKQVKDLGVGVD